jgi:hypothetical protein
MTYIADILMMVEVAEQRSAKPLVKYLRKDQPLTDKMRAWLIKLLEDNAAPRLKFVWPRGRRRTNDKIIQAYDRVSELTNGKITDALCRDIAKGLGLKYRAEWKVVPTRYGGSNKKIYHIGTRFEFVRNKRLSHQNACLIAALQYGLSRAYVRRTYRAVEKAGR